MADQTENVLSPYSSVQQNELFAILLALQDFSCPFNSVSDSQYAVYTVSLLPFTHLPPSFSSQPTSLLSLFCAVQSHILHRHSPFFIIHIRSHSLLPGPLSYGNAKFDSLLIGTIQAATEEYALHHTNARGLRSRFHISSQQAHDILRSCSICQSLNTPLLPRGCNPLSLLGNHIWQMDVFQFPPLGKLRYVHHTIDTFSHFQWATPSSSEKPNSAIQHLLSYFAVTGLPQTLKTDNALAYTFKKLSTFLQHYHIQHITGIPFNSQGQAIIEHANRTFKDYLHKHTGMQGVPLLQ